MKMMLASFLFFVVLFVLSNQVSATNITTCVNTANEIQCMNQTITGNEIVSDTQTIVFKDAKINCDGTNGAVDQPGTGGYLLANAGTGNIVFINTTINCNGGNGGDNNCVLPRVAGAGGASALTLIGKQFNMQKSTFKISGGNSGNPNCLCGGSPCGSARDSGWSRISIQGDTIINWTDTSIQAMAGNPGTNPNSNTYGGNNSQILIDFVNVTSYSNNIAILKNVQLEQRTTKGSSLGPTTISVFKMNFTDNSTKLIFDLINYTNSVTAGLTETFSWNVGSIVAFRNASRMMFAIADDGTTIHRIYLNNPQPNYGIGLFDSTMQNTLRINTNNFSALFRGGFSDPTTITLEGSVTSYNTSFTDYQFFRAINNTFPSILSISYTPIPPVATNNVNCNFTSADDSGSTVSSQYIWWHNGTKNSTVGATFPSARLANGDTLICQVLLTDGILNSSFMNGSLVTLNDGDKPQIINYGLNSTSVYLDEYVQIHANCTDNTSNINSVSVTVLRPSGISQNFSMLFSASKSVNATYDYFANIAGTYNVTNFYCSDAAGNSTSVSGNLLSFISSTPPVPPTPGGGGGGGGGADKGNSFIDLFGITSLNAVIISTPHTEDFLIKFKNTGDGDITLGNIEVSDNLKKYITANVCNLDESDCKNNFQLAKGETKLAKINMNIDASIGDGVVGAVTISDTSRNQKYEILVNLGRPPAFAFITFIAANTGLSLLLSTVIGYLIILGSVGGFILFLSKMS